MCYAGFQAPQRGLCCCWLRRLASDRAMDWAYLGTLLLFGSSVSPLTRRNHLQLLFSLLSLRGDRYLAYVMNNEGYRTRSRLSTKLKWLGYARHQTI